MRTSHPFTRKVLLGLIAAWSLCMCSVTAFSEDMPSGIAFPTSAKGSIQITYDDGTILAPQLHEVLQLDGARIVTDKNTHLFLALSNGLAIGIDQNTEVLVETYTQKPFVKAKESLAYEPSISKLSIRLVRGEMSVASNHLSPLSEARIQLLEGDLRIHSATCVLKNDALGAQITVCDGTVTYQYPDGQNREFIVKPQRIRISPQSELLGKPTESAVLTELPEDIARFAQATQLASQRVFFQANHNGGPPRPVLIVSPKYFEQPAARPYEFSE